MMQQCSRKTKMHYIISLNVSLNSVASSKARKSNDVDIKLLMSKQDFYFWSWLWAQSELFCMPTAATDDVRYLIICRRFSTMNWLSENTGKCHHNYSAHQDDSTISPHLQTVKRLIRTNQIRSSDSLCLWNWSCELFLKNVNDQNGSQLIIQLINRVIVTAVLGFNLFNL